MRRDRRSSSSGSPDSSDITCSWAHEAISARRDLDIQLDELESTILDEHLAGCGECRRYADDAATRPGTGRARPPERTKHVSGNVRAGRTTLRIELRRSLLLGVAAVVVAIAGALAVLVLRGDDPPPELRSIDAVAAPATAGGNLSAYLTIVNDGGSDSITGASSPDAERVVLHTTEMDDGLTTMRHRSDYAIDGEATTIFRPGGAHLMFEGLRSDAGVGDALELTLRFGQAGSRTVSVRVVPMAEVVDRLEPPTD